MNRIAVLCLAAVAVAGCAFGSRDEPRIAVFAKFVRQTAKERGVSISKAADVLYDAGVRGYDCGPDEEDLDELAATRLRPVNFYYFPDWFGRGMHDWNTYYADRTQPSECIAKAKKYGIPRIMVVPPDFTDGKENEAEFKEILARVRGFVEEAGISGISVAVEDYGGTKNCCSYGKYLKRMLTEIPDLQLALDSGNLHSASRGEDILELMEFAKGRIGHVHLKDVVDSPNRSYVTLGLGVVPNERIVKAVAAAGYEGWYTLENPWLLAVDAPASPVHASAYIDIPREIPEGHFESVFAWGGVKDDESARACAQIGVTDVTYHETNALVAARKYGLRTYCMFGPCGYNEQGLAPQERRHFDYINAEDLRRQKVSWETLSKARGERQAAAKCQFGGEPVTAPDICPAMIPCFLSDTNCVKSFAALAKTLEANPEADGVAFDYIGYVNLHSCECDGCRGRLSAWLKENGLEDNEANRNRFFRDGLVNYVNALVDEAKRIRPGIKVAIHLYPVFLPDPLYGRDLKADFIQETVAWYFAWPEEKIVDYTKRILYAKHRPGSVSVPFVGLNATPGSALASKTPERLESELKIILANGGTCLAVCAGGDMLKPGYREVMMKYTNHSGERQCSSGHANIDNGK